MTLQYKIYGAVIAAALLGAGLFAGSAMSRYKIGKLEKAIEAASQKADDVQHTAINLESKAAEYKQKNDYLEKNLPEIQTIARKKDEELEKLFNETSIFRDDVRRARAVRTIRSSGAELCSRLAELGHPCE